MTVAELIEKLKTFPQDAVVIYEKYSDYASLDANDLCFMSKDSEKVKYRGDRFCRVEEFEKAQEALEYKDVVVFPGN